VAKTKEMCIDFRRNPTVTSTVVMDNQPVELVQQYISWYQCVIRPKVHFVPEFSVNTVTNINNGQCIGNNIYTFLSKLLE